MYLSKLEIFGFKSFADKTVIEFDSGVSAIVGPNGSGKSNIVDALRWVLGEQGDKVLRSGKREDVVFNGTKFRKPLSIAEVAVTIQNDKGILPTEYSEVQIARRFFRSGETEYYLNGVKVRLKDIKELFIDTGIGPDAYSVIELKMVETILSDIKHERRKLFEEAAGVVSYKHNRDLTFNRLDAVHESLLRVNDIIREKQRNVNALERQVKRNEEARLVSEELRSLELKTSKFEFERLIREIEDIKSKEESGIKLKDSLSGEIAENDILLDKARADVRDIDARLIEVSKQLGEERSRIEAIERQNLVAGEKLRNYTANIERLEAEIRNLESSTERNAARKSELEDKIKVLNHTIYVSEVSLGEKKSKVDSSVEIINAKKTEIIDLGKRLKEATQNTNTKKAEYEKAKLSYENNLAQLEKLSSSNSSHILNLEKIDAERESLENLLAGKRSDFEKSEKVLKDTLSRLSALNEKASTLQSHLNEKDLELQKAKGKIEYLANLSESLDDYSEGIRFLMKEQREIAATTVLEAIEVEDRFKIAIETALGEVSNYLITENGKDAEELVRILTENEKGKVTFILNGLIEDGLSGYLAFEDYVPDFIGTKGVFGFADQFVRCIDSRYGKLLKYILDEYVIVDNASTAKRLAEDNYYKFITLDGDIFTRGFIRAGSKTNEESVRLGRNKVIGQLEELVARLSSEAGELSGELAEIESERNGIDEEPLKQAHDALRIECDNAVRDLGNLDFRRNQVNAIIAENDEAFSRISAANKDLNSAINTLIEEVSKCDNDLSNLDKELLFLTDEFNNIEQQYSQEQADYNSYNIEFLKLRNELKNEDSNLTRLVSSIQHSERQLASNKEALNRDTALLSEIRNAITANDEELAVLKERYAETESAYSKERSLLDEKSELQRSIDVAQRQRRLDFDSVSQKLINSQIRIKENEIKSEQIREYIFKKYEKDISLRGYISEEGIDFYEFDYAAAKRDVEELSERLKKLGGGYQQILFEDFENEKEELKKLIEQKEDLLESEKDIRKTIDRINQEARQRFLETFEKIRENFIMIFKQLFTEGDEADLRIVYEQDEEGRVKEDPLEAKIEITAKPRGKRPTSIELLSGGEKTLTAIALLFAIYLVKPSPFCVLDEVDAPLDVANLGRFNNMIRKFSGNTQFILITHNERTMESVDRLYGVTMQEAGVTTIVETKFKTGEKLQA
ncbi:MAG: chromosome segregation protein SMC [Ignavibacteria bacterium]|nr:chromosome segregation protein SMC [Ignavibacteria bacterium]